MNPAATGTWLPYDEGLVKQISSAMALRPPNALALTEVAKAIEEGTGREVVCDLATGVGKTYLAAALIEYLARQGVRNILIVTPGKTIYDKTIANFTPGNRKYVPGADFEPLLITAENFSRGQVGDALHDPTQLKLFVFNVQQLIKPTANTSRRTRADDEFIGGALYDHLRASGDLVVIADEHHVYRSSAAKFSDAIRDLGPRALVGLTATPDAADLEKVIYRYPLADAIADKLVKIPVIVYRDDNAHDEATQLADAVRLLSFKEPVWHAWASVNGRERVSPVLFVVCQTINDAERVAAALAGLIPQDGSVLLITSQSSDDALAALADVESASSPVRAIVSVDKLKEGWDVRNIGVIIGLRKLASETLTEQILGRGLRLPFGERTGYAAIDQVDLVAHDSYKQLLQSKEALLERFITTRGAGSENATGRFTVEGADGVFRIVEEGAEATGSGAFGDEENILGGMSDADLLIVSPIGAAEARFAAETALVGQWMPTVAGAPRIVFPRRDRASEPLQFSLESVSLSEAEFAGKHHSANDNVNIQRLALNFERDLEGDVSVTTQKVESVEATQSFYPIEVVRRSLIGRVMDMGIVPAQITERLHAEALIDAFLFGAKSSVSDEATPKTALGWTAKRFGQAEHALRSLITSAFNTNARVSSYRWQEVELLQPRPMPSSIKPWYVDDFVVREWYGEWNHSAEHAVAFDSNTGEFKLAKILDQSDAVRWWLRLYTSDTAFIRWGPGDTREYYPDFLVIDVDGVNWVVEAKAESALLHPDVLAKKAAAEEWVIAVNESKLFGTWRYLLVGESAIKGSSNWSSLVK